MNCGVDHCGKEAVIFLQVTSKIPGRTLGRSHGEAYCFKHGDGLRKPETIKNATALGIFEISEKEYETLEVLAK